jgi:hypothetical protein
MSGYILLIIGLVFLALLALALFFEFKVYLYYGNSNTTISRCVFDDLVVWRSSYILATICIIFIWLIFYFFRNTIGPLYRTETGFFLILLIFLTIFVLSYMYANFQAYHLYSPICQKFSG